MEVRQYKVILVNLDPTIGSEIKKTRPCVIISPNEMNRFLNTVIIAPMTTNVKKYPSRVSVLADGKKGMIVLDQIRTVDKSRIIKVMGGLSGKEIRELKEVLKQMFID